MFTIGRFDTGVEDCNAAIQLLGVLYQYNAFMPRILCPTRCVRDMVSAGGQDVVVEGASSPPPPPLYPLQNGAFVSLQLTSKLIRQLEDPMLIACGTLPVWVTGLPLHHPFLFSQQARLLYSSSAWSDYSRALYRLQETLPPSDTQGPRPCRLLKHKIRLSRRKILESAFKIMELYSQRSGVLEFEYFGEVGTGQGPSMEFYFMLSREFQRKDLHMWVDSLHIVDASLATKSFSIGSGDSTPTTPFAVSSRFPENVIPGVSADPQGDVDAMYGSWQRGGGATEEDSLFDPYSAYEQMRAVEESVQDAVLSPAKNAVSPESHPHRFVNAPCGLFPAPLDPSEDLPVVLRMSVSVARSVDSSSGQEDTEVSLGAKEEWSPSPREKMDITPADLFRLLGRVCARCLMDGRIMDLSFSPAMLELMRRPEQPLSVEHLRYIAPHLFQQVSRLWDLVLEKARLLGQQDVDSVDAATRKKIEDICLDGCPVHDLGLYFVHPGVETIPLKNHGEEELVTIWNLEEYLHLLSELILNVGIRRQMDAFFSGFEALAPVEMLRCFSVLELDELFSGSRVLFSRQDLEECSVCDHGYTITSHAVQFLFEVLCEMTPQEQRRFVLFVTGSPNLPVGGLRSLHPPLTIVRKTGSSGVAEEEYLPSVMTCTNYLKLPDYSTLELMRRKIHFAIQNGQGSFHMS